MSAISQMSKQTDILPVECNQQPDSRSFSSLTVHRLLRSASASPLVQRRLPPVSLHRAVTFPAARCTDSLASPPEPVVWPALPQPPASGTELRVRLGAKIGAGLTGIVHAVSLVDEHGKLLNDLPMGKLCIKLARPRYCRSMAREAWFYEQLAQRDVCEGIVTPRYYGFFTVPLSECARLLGLPQVSLEVGPWVDSPSEQEVEEQEEGYIPDSEYYPGDLIQDDIEVDTGAFYEDDLQSRLNSPWIKWRGSRKDPLIAVLVLERLGRPYYTPEEEAANGGSKKQRNDLHRLYVDLSEAGILHDDIRFQNILRWPIWADMPDRSNPICPRHKRAHRWRIVDFAHSMMVVRHDEDEKEYLDSQRQYIGEHFFYGY